MLSRYCYTMLCYRNKKRALRALLSYISTREFLRTREKCIEKHEAQPSASLCTSLVFLKIPKCLYNSTMHSGAFFISIVLHCASILRTIFASLARAHERVRVQNVRDFPQSKLDSEIDAPFLLNEHGDLHFLFHNFNEDNILNN